MIYQNQGQLSTAVQDADVERTKRVFIGFLSSVLGVDQTYATDDGYISNAPGQYIIANPDGTYSQVGRSVSSQQGITAGGMVITPVMLALLAVAAYVIFKK
jgi:hypothetical protein